MEYGSKIKETWKIETVTTAGIVHETEKAILVEFDDAPHSTLIGSREWLPKSCVRLAKKEGGYQDIEIPVWLIIEKGIAA